MNPTRVAAVVLRQIYLYAGSPQRILPIFAWVALDILLWGFITLYLERFILPEDLYPWLSVASGALILSMGFALFNPSYGVSPESPARLRGPTKAVMTPCRVRSSCSVQFAR